MHAILNYVGGSWRTNFFIFDNYIYSMTSTLACDFCDHSAWNNFTDSKHIADPKNVTS